MNLGEAWSALTGALACAVNPLECGTAWLDAQPVLGVIAVALLVGMILGAWLGRLAVAVLIAVAGVLIFWRRPPAEDSENVPADSPDAFVPRRRRQPTQPRRKPIWEEIRERLES